MLLRKILKSAKINHNLETFSHGNHMVKWSSIYYVSVDGGLSPWKNCTSCSVSCGGGTLTACRSCTNPPPQYGGEKCRGETKRTIVCSLETCGKPFALFCASLLYKGVNICSRYPVRLLFFENAVKVSHLRSLQSFQAPDFSPQNLHTPEFFQYLKSIKILVLNACSAHSFEI